MIINNLCIQCAFPYVCWHSRIWVTPFMYMPKHILGQIIHVKHEILNDKWTNKTWWCNNIFFKLKKSIGIFFMHLILKHLILSCLIPFFKQLTLLWHTFWIHMSILYSMMKRVLLVQKLITHPLFFSNSFIIFNMIPNKVYCNMDN